MRVQRRKSKKPLDLDITSLLDILVILLVFLLQNYNASNLQLEVAKALELANSNSSKLGDQAVVLQVDKDLNLYLDNKKMFTIVETMGDNIPQLLNELKRRSQEHQAQNVVRNIASEKTQQAVEQEKKRKPINLVFDKRLPFQLIQKVLHTASLAGHNQYKFIVQGTGE